MLLLENSHYLCWEVKLRHYLLRTQHKAGWRHAFENRDTEPAIWRMFDPASNLIISAHSKLAAPLLALQEHYTEARHAGGCSTRVPRDMVAFAWCRVPPQGFGACSAVLAQSLCHHLEGLEPLWQLPHKSTFLHQHHVGCSHLALLSFPPLLKAPSLKCKGSPS